MATTIGAIENLCDLVEERMTERSIQEAQNLTIAEQCRHDAYHGDDMGEKGPRVGCRIATLNTAKKLHKARQHKDELTILMEQEKLDILMLQELGKSDSVTIAMFKNYAIEKDMAVEIVSRGPDTTGGGQAMLIGRKWAKLQRTVHEFKPIKADKDRAIAVEFNNRKQGDHNKLMVMGYYGYNNATGYKDEVKEIHTFIWKQIKKFRADNPLASIILLGDFNAAQSTEADTDSDYESGDPLVQDSEDEVGSTEADAYILEHIQQMKMQDALRERYPNNNFVTRKVEHQTNRLLDRIFISKELMGPSLRAAIYQPAIFTYGGTDTDHKMVVVDVTIDCAGGAAEQVKLWSKHKKETLRWDADDVGVIAQEKIDEFNETASAIKEHKKPEGPEQVHEWLLEAATGTVMKKVLQEFPKKARQPKNFQSQDWKLRTGLGKMRESIRHLEELKKPTQQQIRKATAPLRKVRQTVREDQECLHQACMGHTREKILFVIREHMNETIQYLSTSARQERQESITANKKLRTSRFQHRMKKKLKNVITSIMRKAKIHEEITTCNKEGNLGIATSEVEVAREVVAFYKNWMKSKVNWKERWKSWKHMVELDTDGLVNPKDREFIELAYREGFEKFGKLQREHKVWDTIWATIDVATTRRTLSEMNSGTAGGPSGITYDILKALDDDNLQVIADHMQEWLDQRSLPKTMNRSLLRPLPKTDAGLANLALTRPIALMEVIGKLFEKVIFDRIRTVLVDNEMLDASQHGGTPDRSTASPMHNLAETTQDAQVSGQELHVLSADLTKAFDTLEHWSQVMSWRALGMPTEMAEMLMRMDQEGETAIILGQGRTTCDILGEEGWFKSERGVRQGSIGGPIKWIVYMNFWLKYMHTKHENEGYKMSQAGPGDKEIIGQMFIDDSNWFAKSAEGMGRMVKSNETFVHFHGLSFNKKKCEYIVINQRRISGEWRRPKWSTGEQLVEVIRTVTNKEEWTQQWRELDRRVTECRENIHTVNATQIADQDSAWECIQNIDLIHDEMKRLEAKSELRWWAQDAAITSEEIKDKKALTKMIQELLESTYDAERPALRAQAKIKTKMWEAAIAKRNRSAMSPGRAMRYLGVWYEQGFKWERQKQILTDKFTDLNDRISRSSPTREEATYCINATINAALKYPLRVAHIDQSTLRSWDTANRKVVSKAGALPALAPLVYHTPKERGGLGLESLELAVDRGQIEAYIEALNQKGLNGEITRAGRRRFRLSAERAAPEKASTHAVVEKALEKHGLAIVESEDTVVRVMQTITKHNYTDLDTQSGIDIRRARCNQEYGRQWDIYGDGATYETLDRAGWGVWMTTRGHHDEQVKANGRLTGKQSNDGAEAKAILQALLMTHPAERATFYCDNQGCVQKWNKLGLESTMRWGFRATWNRIAALKTERQDNGIPMRMRWVHSHVDDEARRTQKTKKMRCACREGEVDECDPQHIHHTGNEYADEEAKVGAFKDTSQELRELARGELQFTLATRDNTATAQGAYGEWMRHNMTEMSILTKTELTEEETEKGTGERLQEWARGAVETDRKIRTATTKRLHQAGGPSWRFWARAGLHALPTMSQMSKFSQCKGSNYAQVYAPHIGDQGKCTTCGDDKETVEHALWECSKAQEAWEGLDLVTWIQWDEQGLNWDNFNWKLQANKGSEWATLWGLLGMVPSTLVGKVAQEVGYIEAFTLIKETAQQHLITAEGIWQARNERHLEWEAGIQQLASKKEELKRTVWSHRETAKKARKKEPKQGPLTLEEHGRRQDEQEKEHERKRVEDLVQKRELKRNKQRQREHRPILPATKIVRMAEEEANRAVRTIQKRLRKESDDRRTTAQHKAWEEMECSWTQLAMTDPRKLLHGSPQQGQEGWWIPKKGTKVTTFKSREDGGVALGGTKGDWHPGTVSAVSWDEGTLPRCEIKYTCGNKEWHCTSTCGRLIKLMKGQGQKKGGKRMRTDTFPEGMALLLGPGTEVSVRWETPSRNYAWWAGRVVANSGDEVAVRYDAKDPADTAVVWHTDLHERGCRILNIKRMRAEANEQYQLDTQRRAQECVLLTDDGQCECAWCYTKGWPMEIDTMIDQGMDEEEAWELGNLGPREGRARVNAQETGKGKEPETEIEKEREKDKGEDKSEKSVDCREELSEDSEHGQRERSSPKTTGRDMRAARRANICEPEQPGDGGKDQEARAPHREKRKSGPHSRLAGGRSGQRQRHTAGSAGAGVDGTERTNDGEAPPAGPGCNRPAGNPVADGRDELPGSPGSDPDVGRRERRADEGRGPGGAPRGEESAAQDLEEQDLEAPGKRIYERSNTDADPVESGVSRGGRRAHRLDPASGEMGDPESVEHPKRGRDDQQSREEHGEVGSEAQKQRRAPGLAQDPRPGGGMGINRDGSRGNQMCDDRGGQRRGNLPGIAPWTHQGQSAHGLLNELREEPPAEDREEDGEVAEVNYGDMAVTGVHTSVQGEPDEHLEGVCTRAVHREPTEHSSSYTAEARRGEAEVRKVQGSDRAANEGPGGGGHALRTGEPERELLLGTGFGQGSDRGDATQGLENAPGGSMCIRTTGTETDDHTDQHHLGTQGYHREWEMQGGDMRRHKAQRTRDTRSQKAQTTDSSRHSSQEDQHGRNNQRKKRGILGRCSEEQSGDDVGAGNPVGGQGTVDARKREEEEKNRRIREQSKRQKTTHECPKGTSRERNKRNITEQVNEPNLNTNEPTRKRLRNGSTTWRTGIG